MPKFPLLAITATLLLTAGWANAASTASGTGGATRQTSAPAPRTHRLTRRDLGIFFSGLMPYALERADIAGAMLSVVKDGRIIFAQGYGSANLAKNKPVVANRTLFRIGSVSKLFTWTAVMQLVAAGKIDLDRDINAYLDFKIPAKFGKPITMRDLMTMTPGFEEVLRDLIPEKLYPLRRYLANNIPARIFPPGKIVAYSNYGATLGGYIVQRVSGEPFAKYIQRHIFKPLDMADSTFVQPLPAALKGRMSKGYVRASGKPRPFELVEAAPAGSMTSTATDMAHFMIAELNHGRYNGASILPRRLIERMHTQHYSPAPNMNGYDLGFYQENRNGLKIIGHGGDTNLFHSDLHLIPGAHVGIFMAFNSAGKAGAVEKLRVHLFRLFLDRYFPYSPPAEKTVADPKKDAARVAGWYIGTRREESALKLLFLLTQNHVTALPNGEITVSMPFLATPSGTPKRWREVGPLDYRAVGGQAHLKFVADENGQIKYWTADGFPPVELFQRRHGMATLGVLKPATAGFIVVLALALIIWFGAWLVRRRYHVPLLFRAGQYWLRVASRLGALLLLAVVAIWMWIAALLSSGTFAMGGPLLAAYVLGIFGILGGIAIVAEGATRIIRGPGGIAVRFGEALFVLAGLYGIWAILALGLVNFHMSY